MKIVRIELTNFKQFHGKNEIIFSTDDKRNVTLVHAENGVGKTNLLSSILWCFYDQGENLRYDTNVETSTITSVEVQFTHDNRTWICKREKNYQLNENYFRIYEISGGNSKEDLSEPGLFINQVIPQEMAKYFFFDGENQKDYKDRTKVKEATENMLGCSLAIQASEDLEFLIRKIKKDLSKLNRLKESNNLDEMITHCEKVIKAAADKIKEYSEANTNNQKIVDDLENDIKNADVDAAKEMINAENAIKTAKNNLYLHLGVETQWIWQDSLGLLAKKALDECDAIIKDKGSKGGIPAKYLESFVTDILKENECICGTKFDENDTIYKNIEKLYDEAGTLSQNHSFSRIKSLINEFKSRDPVDEYVKIEKKKGELKVALSDQETKLAAIEQRLNNDSPDDIIEKRKSIDARRGEIKQNSINIASLNTEIETNEERLKKFENSRDDANKNNDKYQDLLEKQKFINDVKNNLVSELNKYRDNARAEVTSTINEILTNTARRPYKAEIEEDFTLRMFYDDSEKIIKPSRGEHKLLALSFVSALLKFSKNRISNTNHFLKPGTVAPLMLDSPFGDLDGTYREGIAKYLQGNTEQLILFLSSSQIKETINVLKEFIGKEYVMVIHNMSSQHGEKDFEDYETTKGDTMNSVEFDKEIDRTAIVEV